MSKLFVFLLFEALFSEAKCPNKERETVKEKTQNRKRNENKEKEIKNMKLK
jgi:hypothetical protein